MISMPLSRQAPPGRRPRLLLVDDQPANIQALHRVFAGDCQVLMATDGARALQLCRERQPDLVLLDVQMPGMDGHELCAELKADPLLRGIAVIFVTAQHHPDDETRGLDAGAADFITKPFNPAVVRARVRTQLTLKHQSDLLRELAFVDGLTGVHNRRYFDHRSLIEFSQAVRHRYPLACLFLDIDHFKAINDGHGHPAGDEVLRQVGGLIQRSLRTGDLAARYGGEEFVVLLPRTDLAGAREVAERIRQMVQEAPFITPDGGTVGATLSVGLAMLPAGATSFADLLSLADRALYDAKHAGRNRTVSVTD